MDGWTQWFVLILPLCVHADSKETFVKTIRGQSDISPVCLSENSGLIVFVTCRISTERHRGEECRLQYVHDETFDHKCDTRFSLISKNQTVFIHLTSLTPEDSGNYLCECSYERGTHVTHLNITVKAEEENVTFSGRKFIPAVIILLSVGAAIIITAGIICGHILRRNRHRENIRPGASELTTSGNPRFLDQDDLYVSLQQRASSIYQTVYPDCLHHADAEADPDCIYATIS